MKVSRVIRTQGKKIKKEFLSKIYSDSREYPKIGFDTVLSELLETYNPKNNWNKQDTAKFLDWIYSELVIFIETAVLNLTGYKTKKIHNKLLSLNYLLTVLPKELHNKYEICETCDIALQEYLQSLHTSLAELAYVSNLEYPYNGVSAEFWNRILKHYKSLDYNDLLVYDNLGTNKSLKFFSLATEKYLNEKYSDYELGSIVVTVETITNYDSFIRKISTKEILRECLPLQLAKRLKVLIQEERASSGIEISIDSLINELRE